MTTVRFYRCCLLLLAACFLPLAGGAQEEGHLTGADAIIARANTLGAAKDFDGAVGMLQSALARYPNYAPLYLTLADWQQASLQANSANKVNSIVPDAPVVKSPDTKDIFDTYGLAIMHLADTREIRQRVNELLANGFPTLLGQFGPPALPGTPAPFTYTLSDPHLPAEERGVQQGLITSTPLPVPSAYTLDPKYGRDAHDSAWTFQYMLYGYAFERLDQSWHLRFRVFWQDVPGKEEERAQFAQQVGRVLLQVAGTMRAYTGLNPQFSDDGAVNVWLAENGDPGGEALNENIYLYDIGALRTKGGVEWVRELAHEYSHQTLPPVGGYTQPEWGSNGYLGERLLLHWLMLNPDAAIDTQPWIREIDPGEVNARRVYPDIQKFAALGPEAPQLRAADAEAMDDFIGMALYIEQTQGGHFLGRVLRDMKTPSFAGTNGFLESVENDEIYLQTFDPPIAVFRLEDLPLDLPYWVFLRDGAWKGELQGENFLPETVKLTVDNKDVPLDVQGHFTLTKLSLGWHVFRVTPIGNASSPELTLLKMTR